VFVEVINMKTESDYLSRFVSELKEEFREEDGWELSVDLKLDLIKLYYSDAYNVTEVYIYLNEYKVPEGVTIIEANKDEEIIMPETCHYCSCECPHYDEENDTCLISDEEINREISEWERVLCETRHLRVERVVYGEKCYMDIPHYHYYKAYKVTYTGPVLVETIVSLVELFDLLVELVEK